MKPARIAAICGLAEPRLGGRPEAHDLRVFDVDHAGLQVVAEDEVRDRDELGQVSPDRPAPDVRCTWQKAHPPPQYSKSCVMLVRAHSRFRS